MFADPEDPGQPPKRKLKVPRRGRRGHRDRRRRRSAMEVGGDIGGGAGIFTPVHFVFSTPLSNPNAPDASRSGLRFPCDEEVKAVMAQIAKPFGATVDVNFQIDLPTPTISYEKMEEVMKGLGFIEFFNPNVRERRPSYWFGYGAYHWEGNVLGNWYHLNFVPVGLRPFSSDLRLAKETHYEPDKPELASHGKVDAPYPREPCP